MSTDKIDTTELVQHLINPTAIFAASLVLLAGIWYWRRGLPPDAVLSELLRPVLRSTVALLTLSGLYALTISLELLFLAALPWETVNKLFFIMITLGLLWVPYQWIDIIASLDKGRMGERGWLPHLFRHYRLLFRLAVVALMVLTVLYFTGMKLQSILLAGGVGGIVAGLALKELLADFFSGLSLQANQFINPGDDIRLTERQIEGTITDIGFRMTRLMTYERRPLLLPNSIITSSVIEHLSQIDSRRIQYVVGVRYDDYRAIEAIVADLRAELPQRPSMVDRGSSLICFRAFGSYSLDILVRIFTTKTGYREFCFEVEGALHHTARIVERHGAEFAFPTSVVHLAEEGAGEPGPSIPPAATPPGSAHRPGRD